MLNVSDVFTPNNPPTGKDNVYIERRKFEKDLKKAYQRKATAVIYGDFGVGKTSLCLHTLNGLAGDDEIVIRMTSPEGEGVSDLFALAFEKMDYEVVTSTREMHGRRHDVTANLEGGAALGFIGAFKAFSVKVRAETRRANDSQKEVIREFMVSHPTDEKAIEEFSRKKIIFMVDELHMASGEFRKELSAVIKSVSDRMLDFPKFALCGTAKDAGSIADLNPGVDRLMKEIKVTPLTPGEGVRLVDVGFSRLGVEWEPGIPEAVSEVSGGAPSLIHQIAAELADIALDESRPVGELDLQSALKEVLKERAPRLADRYRKAIEHTGTKRYREKILAVMACGDKEVYTTGEIAAGISEILGDEVPQTAISGPLKQLMSGEYGAILMRPTVGNSDQRNQTCFREPQMKSYIRFVLQARERGVNIDSIFDEG